MKSFKMYQLLTGRRRGNGLLSKHFKGVVPVEQPVVGEMSLSDEEGGRDCAQDSSFSRGTIEDTSG